MLPLSGRSSISKTKVSCSIPLVYKFSFFKNIVFILLYFLFPPFLLQRDVMADANIFQGAIFHEDAEESLHGIQSTESTKFSGQQANGENSSKSVEEMPKQTKPTPKPAVHRVLKPSFCSCWK